MESLIMAKKLVVGMSGSSCSILGIRTLEALKKAGRHTSTNCRRALSP